MQKTHSTVSEYLEFYKTEWGNLVGGGLDASLRDYPNGSIHTTWMVSYEAVKKKNETAANLIQLLAYLDNTDIWFELFSAVSELSSNSLQHLPRWFQGMISSKLIFKNAIQALFDFSMIEIKQDLSAYSVHPVVHEWALQVLTRERKHELAYLSIITVGLTVLRSIQRKDWIYQQRLMPHALCCYQWIQTGVGETYSGEQQYTDDRYVAMPLLASSYFEAVFNLGNIYTEHGKLAEAEGTYLKLLKGINKAFGVEHVSVLNTSKNLGILYRLQDKPTEAEKVLRQVLVGYERLGLVTEPSAMNVVKNLGLIYSSQGRLSELEEMFVWSVNGYEKAGLCEHPSNLDAMDNLAKVYSDQGKFVEAKEMCVRTLQGFEKAYGAEHSLTVNMASRLCALLLRAGSEQNFPSGGIASDRVDFLNEVIKLACKWGTQDLALFGRLGRALLWNSDERNAQIAFQQQVTLHDGIWVYINIDCDGCHCCPLARTMNRFVCKHCEDIDLCGKCYSKRGKDNGELSPCSEHAFLEISSETLSLSNESTLARDTERRSWLHNLTIKYSKEDLHYGPTTVSQ